MTVPTPRTTVRRLPQRGRYDRETIAAILDEGLVCHVGFVSDGQPFVIPSVYGRRGDRLYLHGSAVSSPVPDPKLPSDVGPPPSVRGWRRPHLG